MTIYAGTAGWGLRSADKHLFGKGESNLARYATRFYAAEINSSFHRPHRPATYERWAATVPRGFRFAVKLPRTITHDGRLQDTTLLKPFLEQVAGLGGKLGPLLVQLPPSLIFDPTAAGRFFTALRRQHDGRVACEPRHPSWFEPAPQKLFERHHIARVAADPPRVPSAAEPGGWSGFRYWRWHGSPKIYYSDYTEPKLVDIAANLRRGDWCIFDNTLGAATRNALAVAKLSARSR